MPPKKDEEEDRVLLGRPGNNVKMGIVGLPNVGKSSFFNLMCKLNVPAENRPFCTIDPNVARVPVPVGACARVWTPRLKMGLAVAVVRRGGRTVSCRRAFASLQCRRGSVRPVLACPCALPWSAPPVPMLFPRMVPSAHVHCNCAGVRGCPRLGVPLNVAVCTADTPPMACRAAPRLLRRSSVGVVIIVSAAFP
jgi:hypothetical protein